VDYLVNDYFPFRTDIVVGQLKTKGWYPKVEAPTFNQHGGAVDDGFALVMSAPAGAIYYTLDGSDPRLPGGDRDAAALACSGPVVLTQTTRVRARALDVGIWSAAHDVTFVVGD